MSGAGDVNKERISKAAAIAPVVESRLPVARLITEVFQRKSALVDRVNILKGIGEVMEEANSKDSLGVHMET